MEPLRLYTSRWANKDLAHLAAVCIGISRGVPRFKVHYSYRRLSLLAPSREVFAIEDEVEFTVAYRRELDGLGAERIIAAFVKVRREHGGQPLVLLCYEPADQFCHRRVFADWFKERTGVEVPELVPEMFSEFGLPGKQPNLF